MRGFQVEVQEVYISPQGEVHVTRRPPDYNAVIREDLYYLTRETTRDGQTIIRIAPRTLRKPPSVFKKIWGVLVSDGVIASFLGSLSVANFILAGVQVNEGRWQVGCLLTMIGVVGVVTTVFYILRAGEKK